MKLFSRVSLAVALLGIVLLVDAAPAVARDPHVIKVMTRNEYIGADLTPVILAQTPEDFLAAATSSREDVSGREHTPRD